MNPLSTKLERLKSIVQTILVGHKQKEETDKKYYYSSYGEDVILDHVFEKQASGFYVDIGAFHPVIFSNTKKLYDRGWRGINVDANCDTITLFNQYRPDDINLNYAISDQEGEADYYSFLEIDEAGGGSGNSLSPQIKEAYERQGLKPTVRRVETKPIQFILAKYASNRAIDFMNIDVEGFDLKALQSNDWELFRPKIIAVEIWMENIDYDYLRDDEVYDYLYSKGFKPFSNTFHTWFFYDTQNPIILKKSPKHSTILPEG